MQRINNDLLKERDGSFLYAFLWFVLSYLLSVDDEALPSYSELGQRSWAPCLNLIYEERQRITERQGGCEEEG